MRRERLLPARGAPPLVTSHFAPGEAALSVKKAGGGAADVSAADGPGDAGLTSWVSDEVSGGDRPDLTAARIVVAGGRGLQNGENFDTVLAPLVDKLGAAMGASRAAVDAGFVPNELQIGQTGKVVGQLAQHTDSVEAVAFAADPAMGASASMDNNLAIWDFNTLKLRGCVTNQFT